MRSSSMSREDRSYDIEAKMARDKRRFPIIPRSKHANFVVQSNTVNVLDSSILFIQTLHRG